MQHTRAPGSDCGRLIIGERGKQLRLWHEVRISLIDACDITIEIERACVDQDAPSLLGRIRVGRKQTSSVWAA